MKLIQNFFPSFCFFMFDGYLRPSSLIMGKAGLNIASIIPFPGAVSASTIIITTTTTR
jgi:hypothetical protein